MKNAIQETNFNDLKLLQRGKVRDIYDLGDSLLMVATDRISAYDVIMPDPIPDKGKVLTQISLFWYERFNSIVENHLITSDVSKYPDQCKQYADILKDRSMLVHKAKPFPIECVVRGYISGSGWNSYQESKEVCGIKLPDGLIESDKLGNAIFTPATKEEVGNHDINIDFNEMVNRVGKNYADKLKELSLKLYYAGVSYANDKGIIIADTKFEFGLLNDKIILIDEVLTPDSSRFWPKNNYKPGGPQLSFDKQYLRDYLISINFNKKPPAPSLPEEVINNTRNKYLEALNILTNKI